MSTKVLGFYTSERQEPALNLFALGGGPYTGLNADNISNIFSNIDEYYSTNSLVDYRIIYIKNIYTENVTALNPIVSVVPNFVPYLEFARNTELSNIRFSIFVAPYATTNFIHPPINSKGTFLNTGNNIQSLIDSNSNVANYGPSISIQTSLNKDDFFPLIIRRETTGPLPYLHQYKLNIQVYYGIAT